MWYWCVACRIYAIRIYYTVQYNGVDFGSVSSVVVPSLASIQTSLTQNGFTQYSICNCRGRKFTRIILKAAGSSSIQSLKLTIQNALTTVWQTKYTGKFRLIEASRIFICSIALINYQRLLHATVTGLRDMCFSLSLFFLRHRLTLVPLRYRYVSIIVTDVPVYLYSCYFLFLLCTGATVLIRIRSSRKKRQTSSGSSRYFHLNAPSHPYSL